MPISAKSSVATPRDTYYEIHVILDKSASMLLAATTADQQVIKQLPLNCVFACHDTAYGAWFNGVYYNSYYDFARQNGVKLRADVQASAVGTLMDTIDKVDPTHQRVKVALYSLGSNTNAAGLLNTSYNVGNGIRQVRALTNDTSVIRSDIVNNAEWTSATSYISTDYRALTTLPNTISAAGSGTSAASPYKLVVMITDGTQSSADWVFSGWNNITPINPTWCKPIKDKGVTFAVLYTEYLPWNNRVEYTRSLGSSMGSSSYQSQWGATMPSPSTTTRHDYLSTALSACASSPQNFIMASDPASITSGLTAIVGSYLGAVRLTQ